MQLNLTIGPLALFALVASITPGPNNFLLMRSGARFGVRGSTAPMLGIQGGMVGLLLLSHLGVGALLLAWPFAMTVLRWACFVYLLWLASVILRDAHSETRAADRRNAVETARPMTFVSGLRLPADQSQGLDDDRHLRKRLLWRRCADHRWISR